MRTIMDMPDSKISIQRRIDSISNDFEDQWSLTSHPNFADYLSRIAPQHHKVLLQNLLEVDVELAIKAGREVTPSDYVAEGEEAVACVERLLAESSRAAKGQSGASSHKVGAEQEVPALIGSYSVDRELGCGRFGQVFLARDFRDRQVAIKLLHPRHLHDSEIQEQFAQEATILERLQHPGIVNFRETFKTEQGQICLVTEYLSGGTLHQQMQSNDRTPEETAAFVAKLAGALHQMHLQGFTHRDVKPANILLDDLGQPRLADVGLALSDEAYGIGDRLVTGSLAYLSPEQARGDSHLVDGRTDIYSLGLVMYEMLAGRRPFHADETTELLRRIQNIDVKPLRQINARVPKRLEEICLKATSKDATKRYTTAEDLANALQDFLPPPPTTPLHFLNNILFHNRKNTLVWMGAFLFLMAIVSAVTCFIVSNSGHPRNLSDEKKQIRSNSDIEKPLVPEQLALHNSFVPPEVISASQKKNWSRVIEIETKRRDHHPVTCHRYTLRVMGACVLNNEAIRFKNERVGLLVDYELAKDYATLEQVSKACLLLHADIETLGRIEELLDRAFSVDDVAHPEYAITTKGLLHYRKGEYRAAIEQIEDLMEHPIKEIRFLSTVISAMANHQIGEHNDAEKLLKKSKQMMNPKSRRENYIEWIESQILYSEARRLITMK